VASSRAPPLDALPANSYFDHAAPSSLMRRSGTKMSHGLIEITPDGIKHPHLSLRYRLGRWRRHAAQIMYLARLSIISKTQGRTLGKTWIILDPLLQTIVYFTMLQIIFKVNGTDVSFLTIFVSINVWRLSNTLFVLAPTMVNSYGVVLQQTSFPIEVLLLHQILAQLFTFGLNMIIVFVILAFGHVYPDIAWIAFPFVLLVHLSFTLAVVMLVAALGAIIKDMAEITNVIVQVWFYLSPVVYGMERVPEPARTLMEWTNPFVTILPAYREVLLDGQWPDARPLILILLLSGAAIVLQLRFVNDARHRFYSHM
jgi:ABC-type polysaccharide/polyol phosphate export permease